MESMVLFEDQVVFRLLRKDSQLYLAISRPGEPSPFAEFPVLSGYLRSVLSGPSYQVAIKGEGLQISSQDHKVVLVYQGNNKERFSARIESDFFVDALAKFDP